MNQNIPRQELPCPLTNEIRPLNRSRDFWSEISKIRRKTHITPCTVEGFSNNEDISSCFSGYYKDLYNSVSFDSIEWSKLLTIIVYSGMRLVFPIAMHTIEIIKQYNTCAFYIHKSKKEEKK